MSTCVLAFAVCCCVLFLCACTLHTDYHINEVLAPQSVSDYNIATCAGTYHCCHQSFFSKGIFIQRFLHAEHFIAETARNPRLKSAPSEHILDTDCINVAADWHFSWRGLAFSMGLICSSVVWTGITSSLSALQIWNQINGTRNEIVFWCRIEHGIHAQFLIINRHLNILIVIWVYVCII